MLSLKSDSLAVLLIFDVCYSVAKPVIRTNVVGKVMEGVTTALKCHANGVPEPTVQWQVAQYALPSDKSRYNWHSK